MPTLLQINVCYGYYSTGKIVENINEIVTSHGWNSYVAYRADVPCRGTAKLIPIGNDFSKYYHLFNSFLFDSHGLSSNRATRKLIEEINRIEPDIIHLHNIHGYYLNFQILLNYLRSIRVPIVITVHDCWLFTGHCAHFTKISCSKWKTGCCDCKLTKSYPKSLIDNSSFNYRLKYTTFSQFDKLHIVTVSDWLAQIVKDSFLGSNDIRVIHNGIDTDIFKIVNSDPNGLIAGSENTKFVLGVSSAWYEDKGLDDYYALSKILPPNIKICLVGVTGKQKKKLPSNIVGIEKTTHIDDLVMLYNRAEVVLSLSKSETFGLTIVEGYACGTPAIVYNNTALPELVTPSSGFVVPNGDIEAVRDAIVKICQIGKNAYASECRRLAITNYNYKSCFSEYYNLYNEILNQKCR